jgi:hypothetical protein
MYDDMRFKVAVISVGLLRAAAKTGAVFLR